jgi:hypothetical protein
VAWWHRAGQPLDVGWIYLYDPQSMRLISELSFPTSRLYPGFDGLAWSPSCGNPSPGGRARIIDSVALDPPTVCPGEQVLVTVSAVPPGIAAGRDRHRRQWQLGTGPSQMTASGADQTPTRVVYVMAGAVGKNNGTSWQDAYTEVQSALMRAGSGDEIWVVKGVYKPVPDHPLLPTCQSIRSADPTAGDSDYWIGSSGKNFLAYCYDMAGTPKEYVTVDPGNNYSLMMDEFGATLRTRFSRVRVDPGNLNVDIADTFSDSTGVARTRGGAEFTSMPYASASSCKDGVAAQSKVDISGTPFALHGAFHVWGCNDSGDYPYDNQQRVTLNVEDACGHIYPVTADQSSPELTIRRGFCSWATGIP